MTIKNKTKAKKLTDIEIMKKIDDIELKYFLDSPTPNALARIAKLYRKVENPDTMFKRATGFEDSDPKWRYSKYTLLHMAIVSCHPQSLVPLVMQKNPNPNIKDNFGDDAVRIAARVAESGFIDKGTINLVYEYSSQWKKEKLDPYFKRKCQTLYKISLESLLEKE